MINKLVPKNITIAANLLSHFSTGAECRQSSSLACRVNTTFELINKNGWLGNQLKEDLSGKKI